MRTKNWYMLAGFVVLSMAAGLLGSFFTAPAIGGWYATLVKPELAPPNWVFAPVWTTLYVLMGIAAFLAWRAGGGRALPVFYFQLALNALWSILFFGLQSPGLGLACIAALWLAIVWTAWAFAHYSRAAALLLLPYLAWVSFASYLNYMLWALN